MKATHVEPQYLNETVWATLKPSPIHGVGVFALRDITKGQRLHFFGGKGWITTDLDKLDSIIRDIIIQRWPIAKDGHAFLSPNDDAMLFSFLNHADKPNYDKETDKALRDIKAGEEITEDYGKYKDVCIKRA